MDIRWYSGAFGFSSKPRRDFWSIFGPKVGPAAPHPIFPIYIREVFPLWRNCPSVFVLLCFKCYCVLCYLILLLFVFSAICCPPAEIISYSSCCESKLGGIKMGVKVTSGGLISGASRFQSATQHVPYRAFCTGITQAVLDALSIPEALEGGGQTSQIHCGGPCRGPVVASSCPECWRLKSPSTSEPTPVTKLIEIAPRSFQLG